MATVALTVLLRPTATEQAGASGAVQHPLAEAVNPAPPARIRNSRW